MSIVRALRAVGLVIFGYIVAVFAAVVVTEAVMLGAETLRDASANGSAFPLLSDFPLMLAVGLFWTFLCALPGFVVAVLLGERRRWSRWLAYAAAGLVNVIPSLAIFSGLAGSPFEMPMMVAGAFPGGFAGGAAYWMSAGRYLVRRRSAPPA